MIAAFLLLFSIFLFIGCESPGSVGKGYISDEENIETNTIDFESLTVVEENAYTGRLSNTPIGYFEDPIYGTVKSIAFLKPGISRSEVDTLLEDSRIYLRLILSPDVYGNENSGSSFEIFEAGEIWRGNQLRYSDQVEVDYSSKVGEFQLAGEDTLEVEMNPAWIQKYAEFFNSDESNRDSLYVRNFPGIAIVPAESNQKIRFLKHSREEEEDIVTSFVVDTTSTANGNEEEEEESEKPDLTLRDWGASLDRTDEPEPPEGFVLHNTNKILKIGVDLPVEDLKSKNIVNAQLILSKNTGPGMPMPEIIRPSANFVSVYAFTQEPLDLIADIFTFDTPYNGSLDEEEDESTFAVDITQYVINEVYGEHNRKTLFLNLQPMNGIIYSSHFYGMDGPDGYKPRIVITSVK